MGSIFGAIAVPITMFVMGQPLAYSIFSVIAAGYVIKGTAYFGVHAEEANYTIAMRALAEGISLRGSGSPKKWQAVTPAIAAGLTDHMWTMEELLSYRVPPDFRDRLDQQVTNVTS
jgi:hypothetical protein